MFAARKKLLIASLGLLSSFTLAHAAAKTGEYVVVAPQCLTKNIHTGVKTLATQQSLSLLAVNEAGVQELMEAKHQTGKAAPCGGFMDVTEDWKAYQANKLTHATAAKFLAQHTAEKTSLKTIHAAYSIRYSDQVKQVFNQLNPTLMWNNLTTLSNFQDRYADSDNGVKAANWIKTQVEAMAKEYHREVTVYTVATGNRFKQPSVVAKFGNSTAPGIVVGGHMDTLSGTFSKKPGADDDGTGTVTVLETARAIFASGMDFKKPIYFVWYAAEEAGLVGSSFVVADFKAKNIPVDAVIQMDMTGYSYKNQPDMWLIDDFVNKDLTVFLETLINTYVNKPVKHTACGYACSDHASWTQKGFVSAMPSESAFQNMNPGIHSSGDVMEKLSLTHMESYLKLSVAFAVELAEPVV